MNLIFFAEPSSTLLLVIVFLPLILLISLLANPKTRTPTLAILGILGSLGFVGMFWAKVSYRVFRGVWINQVSQFSDLRKDKRMSKPEECGDSAEKQKSKGPAPLPEFVLNRIKIWDQLYAAQEEASKKLPRWNGS